MIAGKTIEEHAQDLEYLIERQRTDLQEKHAQVVYLYRLGEASRIFLESFSQEQVDALTPAQKVKMLIVAEMMQGRSPAPEGAE